MSNKNTKKFSNRYDEDFEDEWTSRSTALRQLERRKNKHRTNALRSKNVSYILQLEDDEED